MSMALKQTRTGMTDAEWQARCELAALYRVVDHLGWTDLINTHMSLRVPGEPDAFLINRYGEMFDEITASSLIKMDMDGIVREGGKFNNAGFTIHSGVYKARPDANCVMHTHTRAGAGVSLLENGLRPISQDALQILDDVAYHAYGLPATLEECDALGRTCAKGSCVVLLNHGLLALGPTGVKRRVDLRDNATRRFTSWFRLVTRCPREAGLVGSASGVGAAASRSDRRRRFLVRLGGLFSCPGLNFPGDARSRGQAWPQRGHRRSRLVLDRGEHDATLVQAGRAVMEARRAGAWAPPGRRRRPAQDRDGFRASSRSRRR